MGLVYYVRVSVWSGDEEGGMDGEGGKSPLLFTKKRKSGPGFGFPFWTTRVERDRKEINMSSEGFCLHTWRGERARGFFLQLSNYSSTR